jgi:hypothetical protein
VDTNLGDGNAFEASRKPLVAEFIFNTRHVTVIDVHFTSKGGSTPIFGRIQPFVNGNVEQRTAQATIVRAEIDALLAAGASNVVAIGDFNEFDFNEPLVVLEGAGATAMTNLTKSHTLLRRYSYVFEGNSQSLDHVFLSQALVPDALHDIVHVNAEFADQTSDHDPQVASLKLPHPTAKEVLQFFDDAVESGALTGASSKAKVAEDQLDDFRDDLWDAASKERKGHDGSALAHLKSAFARVDGDSKPSDTIAGTAKEELATLLASAIDGLKCPCEGKRDGSCRRDSRHWKGRFWCRGWWR